MSLRALRGEISSASFPCEQRDLHILEILQDFRKKRVMLPFDLAGSPFALGAKATPAPKNTLTNNPFGPVIRRIYILMLHKGPQRLSNFIILSLSLSFSFSLKNRERERDDLSVISL